MHGEKLASHDMPNVFLGENLASHDIAEAFLGENLAFFGKKFALHGLSTEFFGENLAFLGENFAGNDIRDCFPDIFNRGDEVGDAAKEMEYLVKVFNNSVVDIFIGLPGRLND